MQRGVCGVWCQQHDPGKAPNDPGNVGAEYNCWIQAVSPAEVQSPGRVYYLADSHDYRPAPKGQLNDSPPGGYNSGWEVRFGNKVMLGTRHGGYANAMYLDGRVTRSGQTHQPQWNLNWDSSTGTLTNASDIWRVGTFATTIPLADLQTEWSVMPVLCVRGWEYFFEVNGMLAK